MSPQINCHLPSVPNCLERLRVGELCSGMDRMHLGNTKKNEFSFGISLDLHTIFAARTKHVRIMTTVELNAQIWRDMAEIADSEQLMKHPRTGTGKPEQLKGDRAVYGGEI